MNGLTIRAIRGGQWIVRSLLLAGAIAIAPLAAADDFSIESHEGVVDTADFDTNRIVISGVSYEVALDAHVEVGGSFGAFTLLAPGMNVTYVIRRYFDTGERQIIDIKEMPDGVEPRLM